MSGRWFNVAVLVFWLAAMSWLVVAKILPPLIVGDPPSYRTILEAADGPRGGVTGWDILLDGRPLGWAVTQTERRVEGVSELRSRVRLFRLPLAELAPAWFSPAMKLLGGGGDASEFDMGLDSSAMVEIGPLGRPVGVRSFTHLGPAGERLPDEQWLSQAFLKITLRGVIEGDQMQLTLQTGDIVQKSNLYFPSEGLLADALAPQSRLPGLRVGQRWTVPVSNPFSSATGKLDVLVAEVVRSEPILWDDRLLSTLVVEYRPDPSGQLSNNQQPTGHAWVDKSGRVLKQEAHLGAARLTFVRLPPSRAVTDDMLPRDTASPLPQSMNAVRDASTPPASIPANEERE